MRWGRRDSSNGDLAKIGGGRFCTVKWSVLGAYRNALGACREVGSSCSLERDGLEKEVLYPPKWRRFDAEKEKLNQTGRFGMNWPIRPVHWLNRRFNRSDVDSTCF